MVPPGPRALRTVYTAMHGVGAETLRAAMDRSGFDAPHAVVEQVEPDPDFPTVAFPTPEEPGAIDLSLALARRTAADPVPAPDPDADRPALDVTDPTAPRRWRAPPDHD